VLCKYGVEIADVNPPVDQVAVERVERVVTKVVWFFNYCPYEKVLVFAGSADASPAS
jgi:hypothetical protein